MKKRFLLPPLFTLLIMSLLASCVQRIDPKTPDITVTAPSREVTDNQDVEFQIVKSHGSWTMIQYIHRNVDGMHYMLTSVNRNGNSFAIITNLTKDSLECVALTKQLGGTK